MRASATRSSPYAAPPRTGIRSPCPVRRCGMSRVGVTEHDVHEMLTITRDYEHDDPESPLPAELLHDLWQLVPCDLVSVSGQDTPHWDFFADQEHPCFPATGDESDLADAYREHYWDAS